MGTVTSAADFLVRPAMSDQWKELTSATYAPPWR
jgi:hypothetical protein